jgi:GAF domain-containing protein
VLSRLRAGPGRSAAVTHEPVEAAVVRPDGSEVPVVLTARRTTDPETGRPWFHWEVQEQGAPAAAATGRAVAPPGTPVATALAEVAAELARRDDPVQALEYVAAKAATLVPGSDAVGVTIARSGGRVEAAAATHELAEACDRVQFQLHEGPCLSAMDVSAPKHALDLAREKRWPRFARLAARVGARSLIAVPLTAQRGTVGALTFYARTPNAFDREDVLLAQAYATHAAIALAHAELEANLRLGMETREEIGRAVGILMERHRITSAAAFDMLVLASQQSHRKLRDIAAWMNETGEDPSTLISEPEQPPG